MGIQKGLSTLPSFPSEFTLELGFPKQVGILGSGESLFSTHVSSAFWGSMGLGESMQRPGGTECLGLKVVPSAAYFPHLILTLFREGRKLVSILETKPIHGL